MTWIRMIAIRNTKEGDNIAADPNNNRNMFYMQTVRMNHTLKNDGTYHIKDNASARPNA